MTQLILTDEQARLVAQALEVIQVCDPKGKIIGHIKPDFTEEDIRKAKETLASKKPGYTTQQVLAHLRGLEEAWEREGPFDEGRMQQLLDQFRAEDKK